MYRLLALFTVACWPFITTGHGAVQYDHLDLGSAVYNAKNSEPDWGFAIAPFGLGTMLTAISQGIKIWRHQRNETTACTWLLDYEEPLGTNESITAVMNNDFKDVTLRHGIKFYIARNSLLASRVPKTETTFPVNYSFIDFDNTTRGRITDEMHNWSGGLFGQSFPSNNTRHDMTGIFLNMWTFEGRFEKPFQDSIFQYDFHKNGTSVGKVPFLYLRDQLKYVHSPEMHCTIVEIPYKEKDFSMIAILPDVDTPIHTMKIHLPKLWRLLDRTDQRYVVLQVPKFYMNSAGTVRNLLYRLNMPVLLKYSSREDASYRKSRVKIDIRHNVFFAFAAETTITEQPIYSVWKTGYVLKFDRQFLIIVRYKELALIMVRIDNPKNEGYIW